MIPVEAGAREGRADLERVAVHAHGPAEFFKNADRLPEAVMRLTNLYEQSRPRPCAVTDAPEAFLRAQLRGAVGLQLPIMQLEGTKRPASPAFCFG
jgi:transcriptional regulator